MSFYPDTSPAGIVDDKYQEAVRIFERKAKDNPTKQRTLEISNYVLGLLDETLALTETKKSIMNDSTYEALKAKIQKEKGIIYAFLGQIFGEEEHFKKSIYFLMKAHKEGKDDSIFRDVSLVFEERKDYVKALEFMERYLRSEGTRRNVDRDVLLKARDLYKINNRQEGVIYCLDRIIAEMEKKWNHELDNTELAQFYCEKVIALKEAGDMESAKQTLKKAFIADTKGASIIKRNLHFLGNLVDQSEFSAAFRDVVDENGRILVNYSHIGGMDEIKDLFEREFIRSLESPDLFKHYDRKVGGSMLLYGPYGVGKTLFMSAVIGQANLNSKEKITLLSIDPVLLKTGPMLENYINNARKTNKPSFLFLDEIDSICGESIDVANARKQLQKDMTYLEGINAPVFIAAATNKPWFVFRDENDALLRPGRFTRHIYVGPPDDKGRKEIFEIHLKGKPTDKLDYEELARRVPYGTTPAMIRNICDQAAGFALEEAKQSGLKRNITMDDLYKSIKIKDDNRVLNEIDRWYREVEKNINRKEFQNEKLLKDLDVFAGKKAEIGLNQTGFG